MARTGRSRKGVGGPKTPEGRQRALMNLRPFQQQKQEVEIEAGERERRFSGRDYHGAYEITLLQPKTRQVAAMLNGILEGEASSYIRPADQVTVGLLAVALRRIQQCEQYLDKVGSLTNAKGQIRPVAELLVRLLKEAREYCQALGLTPAARVKMGLDVARTFDLAEAMAEKEADKVDEIGEET